MPTISELPDTLSTLTGAELLPIVQDQETRQATLSALLAASLPRQLANARWFKVIGGDLINAAEYTFNYDPTADIHPQFLAKVDVRRLPSDLLLWESLFTAELLPNDGGSADPLTFDGNNDTALQGTALFLDGRYTITTANGDFDNGKTIEVQEVTPNGDFVRLLHTFTNHGQTAEFTSTYGQFLYLKLIQPNGLFVATLDFLKTHYYDGNGAVPTLTESGDLLIVRFDYAPRRGQLTARATLYAGDGTVLNQSDPLTLILHATSSGGSGNS